ncbi:hypothetical protein BV20DRAFT_936201 [Pilatotrama ljubarskyi]|nr:hypothetical protein BV20DRAFT_936201 [Pilatotrama ljubarskyi]
MDCIIRTPRYEAVAPTNKTIFIVLPTTDSTSDADPGRVPANTVPTRDEQGLVNYYEQADQAMERLWREKLGRYLYDHVVKEDMARQGIRPRPNPDKVYLANFPANYTLWVHKKGHPHDPRKDHYLYGKILSRARIPRKPLEPGSPSKILSRRQKSSVAPSPKASAAAYDVLMKYARTNTPASLACALPSYPEDPHVFPVNGSHVEDSYIAHEALRIERARCCWEILKEGFVRRDGDATISSPRKPRARRATRSHDVGDDGWGGEESEPPAPVSEHAWGVLGWMLTLFERDEAGVEQSGQVRYSPLLLAQIPPSRAERAARWDVDIPLDVAFYALQQESEARRSLGVRLLALLINLGSTTLLDFPMFLNAVSTRVSSMASQALEYILSALPITRATAQFKVHLCKHTLGGSSTSVKGRPKPQARARALPRRRVRADATEASVDADATLSSQGPSATARDASATSGVASVARKYPAIAASDVLDLLAAPNTSDPGSAMQLLFLKSELVVSYGLLQQQVDDSDRDPRWLEALRDGSLLRAVEEAFDSEDVKNATVAEGRHYVLRRRDALLAVMSVWQMQ